MAGYEDIVSIPKFAGINQSGDGYNTDLKYAYRGKGFDTRLGDLTPWKAPLYLDISGDGIDYSELPTLAFISKRWTMGQSGVIPADKHSNQFCIVVANGNLYWIKSNYQGGASPFSFAECHKMDGISFTNSKFDTLTYELNYAPPVDITSSIKQDISSGGEWYAYNNDDYDYYKLSINSGGNAVYTNKQGEVVIANGKVRKGYAAPVDCLLMTNADDGMYCVYIPLDSDEPLIERITVMPIGTTEDIKFGCIERYCERVFGSGMSTDNDKIMYSAPYDVFNWEQNNAEPDDGAGDIQQPEWDGDRFISLKAVSTYLLCIKKHSVWKISGDYPSQFYFIKMYGEGTIADGSVCTHGYYTYFLAEDGIKVFDGQSTQYLKYGWLDDLKPGARISDISHTEEQDIAMADNYGDFYVLKPHSREGTLILYNTVEGMFNIVEEPRVLAIKEHDGQLYCLSYWEDEGNEAWGVPPQRGIDLKLMFRDEFAAYDVEWESAWIDLGAKNVTKSGFVVYMYLEDNLNGEGFDPENPYTIPVEITIQSEKKTKVKQVNLLLNKPKKININCNGRMYKLKFKIPANTADYTGWHMRSGMNIQLEYDYD